jgi:hypothetical protein
MAVKDIILEDNDLVIENGDFKIGESDQQSIELIIDSYLGHWKESPLCGVGVDLFLNSSGQQLALKRAISVQLEADGMINVNVTSNSSELLDLTISADRSE